MAEPLSESDREMLNSLRKTLGLIDENSVPENINPSSFKKAEAVGGGAKPDRGMFEALVEEFKKQGYVMPSEEKAPADDKMLPPTDYRVEPIGPQGKSESPMRG